MKILMKVIRFTLNSNLHCDSIAAFLTKKGTKYEDKRKYYV